VNLHHVGLGVRALPKSLGTKHTFVGLFTGVSSHVSLFVGILRKSLVANFTNVRFGTGVGIEVVFEITLVRKGLSTVGILTNVRLFSGMCANMLGEVGTIGEAVIALVAYVWLFAACALLREAVNVHENLERTLFAWSLVSDQLFVFRNSRRVTGFLCSAALSFLLCRRRRLVHIIFVLVILFDVFVIVVAPSVGFPFLRLVRFLFFPFLVPL